MKAEQLHYTSCRRGRTGHAGFQVRAASPGLAAHEEREIERRASYRPPRDLPPQPTATQIAEEFPVALRYAPLEGGRALLLRAAYCGRDYTRRWGNFFTHALAFDGADLDGAWPVDHADWPGWRGCLGDDNDGGAEAPTLPVVELPAPEPEGSFGWDDLRDFLTESPERPGRLAEMGRAVLLAESDSRRLVIRDLRTAGWYWVACVTKLFPPLQARRLGFSTYEDDPRSAVRITATCGDTDFTFDEAQRRYQFYAFDLVGDRHSEVPASDDDYPAVAASWLADRPERLMEFFRFMDLFEPGAPITELDAALRLFRISEGELPLPAGSELETMIRFAVTHATAEGRARLVDQVAKAAEPSRRALGAEERGELLRFFADAAASSGRRGHREIAYRAWLAMVDAVLEGTVGVAAAESGEALLLDRLADHRAELADLFLRTFPPRAAEGRNLEGALFLLRTTGRMLSLAGRTPAWKQEEIGTLARSLLAGSGEVARRLLPLLDLAGDDAEGVATFCRLAVACGVDGRRTGRTLAGHLAALPPSAAADVRRRLDQEDAWPVLLGEWLQICEAHDEPTEAYRRYRRTVLDVLPGYGHRYRPVVVSSILEALPDDERLPLVRDWLEGGEIETFPDDLAERCLEVANRAVDLLDRGEAAQRWSRRVAEAAAGRGAVLRPDRPALREGLARLRTGRGADEGWGDRDAAALRDGLTTLPGAEYRQVVGEVLPEALRRSSDPTVHRRVLLLFHRADESGARMRSYRRFLRAQRRLGAWSAPLAAALDLYLSLDTGRPDDASLADLDAPLRTVLRSVLRRLSDEAFDRICREQGKAGSSARRRTRWRDLESAVRHSRRGVLGRLKDRLKRTTKKGGSRV